MSMFVCGLCVCDRVRITTARRGELSSAMAKGCGTRGQRLWNHRRSFCPSSLMSALGDRVTQDWVSREENEALKLALAGLVDFVNAFGELTCVWLSVSSVQ